MENIKWKYDKSCRQWWTGETVPWANDGFTIHKDSDIYRLELDWGGSMSFKKLSSAKTVANLLRHG